MQHGGYGSGSGNKKTEFTVKNADMADDMIGAIEEIAKPAFDKHNVEKDIASYIKKECDKQFDPTWHCVVGKNYGSYVTHESKHFIYFNMGAIAVLLFKSG